MKMSIDIRRYELTPLEASEATNFEVRIKPILRFNWNIDLPNNPSSLYKVWVKNKKHIELMFPNLLVMSSDELYRISRAIDNELVPPIFRDYIQYIKMNRDHIAFLGEIKIDVWEPFLYNDNEKLRKDFIPKAAKRITPLIPQIEGLNVPPALQEMLKGIQDAKHDDRSKRAESSLQ